MKKIILSCFVLVFASMFISLAEAGEYINDCPVPDNLKIIEPDGNVVPPKLALLSGIWEGNWLSSADLYRRANQRKRSRRGLCLGRCNGKITGRDIICTRLCQTKMPNRAGRRWKLSNDLYTPKAGPIN